MSGNAEEHKLQTCLPANVGQVAARVDMLLFVKHSCKATNYILLFLLSYSSFLDRRLVPSIGNLVASSLIKGELGVDILVVNAGEVKKKKKKGERERKGNKPN